MLKTEKKPRGSAGSQIAQAFNAAGASMAKTRKKTSVRRTRTEPKPEIVAVVEVLPSDIPTQPESPPLENEPPHRALARCNARHAQLTEELRQLKADWAAKNIKAQQLHLPVSTPEITHVAQRRRELHLELEKTQAEIGRLNKLVRERKFARQAGKPVNGDRVEPKRMPLADDPEFPSYFVLAAKNELVPALYAQVERVAKSLMHEAKKMGIER